MVFEELVHPCAGVWASDEIKGRGLISTATEEYPNTVWLSFPEDRGTIKK
jgi:hypothetical protein